MSLPPPKNRLDVNKLHLFSIPHKGTGGSGVRSASADVKQGAAKATPAAAAPAAANTRTAADPFRREVSSASKRSLSSADMRQKIKERMQKPPSIPVSRGGAAAEKMTPAFIDDFWNKRERKVISTPAPAQGVAPSNEKENVPRFASASRSAPLKPMPKLTGKVVEPKKVLPTAAPATTDASQPRAPSVQSPNTKPTRPLSPSARTQARPASPNAAAVRKPSPTMARPLSPSPAAKQQAPGPRKPSPKPDTTTTTRLASPARAALPAPARKKAEGEPSPAPQVAKRPVLAQRKVIVGSGAKPKPKPKHVDPSSGPVEIEGEHSDLVVFTPAACEESANVSS